MGFSTTNDYRIFVLLLVVMQAKRLISFLFTYQQEACLLNEASYIFRKPLVFTRTDITTGE